MNNAPFRVGQKMVRIGPSVLRVKRGDIVTCAGCFQCECGDWEVMIKELPVSEGPKTCLCHCGVDSGYHPYRVGAAKNFAPIPPRSIEIPESLKEQAEEMKDLAETIAPMKKELV